MVDFRSRTSCFTSSNSPSFSSTLLEAIYRSIDHGEHELMIYRESIRKNQSYSSFNDGNGILNPSHKEIPDFRRDCVVEKKISEKVVVRRKSAADLNVKISREVRDYSSLTSSDYGGDGFYLKPVRTGVSALGKTGYIVDDEPDIKPKREGGFLRTKSRALKIYGDLKKVKQPISPGGKLAAFLNSLFTGGNLKKPPPVSDAESPSTLKSGNASTCSSASSFSRSCLSKTPSSRGKSNGVKRSVRFSPVSVIVDDKPQPQKQLDHSRKDKIKIKEEVMEKNRRVDELKNYQRKNQVECDYKFPLSDHSKMKNKHFMEEEDDDDDDAGSCASSDLFELDNLSGIGLMERYREELPVYETTHLDAIANGFIC